MNLSYHTRSAIAFELCRSWRVIHKKKTILFILGRFEVIKEAFENNLSSLKQVTVITSFTSWYFFIALNKIDVRPRKSPPWVMNFEIISKFILPRGLYQFSIY